MACLRIILRDESQTVGNSPLAMLKPNVKPTPTCIILFFENISVIFQLKKQELSQPALYYNYIHILLVRDSGKIKKESWNFIILAQFQLNFQPLSTDRINRQIKRNEKHLFSLCYQSPLFPHFVAAPYFVCICCKGRKSILLKYIFYVLDK